MSTRDDFERLVVVEQKLEQTRVAVQDFKDDNDRRLDELKALITEQSLMGLIKNNKALSYPIIIAVVLNQLGWNPAQILDLLVPAVKAAWP